MNWEQLYTHATEAFGSAPTAHLEDQLLRAYEQHPIGVTRLLEQAIEDAKAGTVYSWGVVARRLDDLMRKPRATPDAHPGRKDATTRAEQRTRHELLHYDRPDEASDELFGDRGTIRTWAEDQQLRSRLDTLWHELRPVGERIEREADERARRYLAHQALVPQAAEAERRRLDQLQSSAPLGDSDIPF